MIKPGEQPRFQVDPADRRNGMRHAGPGSMPKLSPVTWDRPAQAMSASFTYLPG